MNARKQQLISDHRERQVKNLLSTFAPKLFEWEVVKVVKTEPSKIKKEPASDSPSR